MVWSVPRRMGGGGLFGHLELGTRYLDPLLALFLTMIVTSVQCESNRVDLSPPLFLLQTRNTNTAPL